MPPPLGSSLAALAALAALLAGCAEGLSNAPAVNRKWTQEDFQHDVIANGPESCPREGKDPLKPAGPITRACPEGPAAPRGNVPATP